MTRTSPLILTAESKLAQLKFRKAVIRAPKAL